MSDDTSAIVLLLMAAAAGAGAVAAWTGAWRSWARQFLFGAVGSWPITLMPAIAFMCLSGGLAVLGAAGAIVGALFLVGLILFGVFLVNPRWWGPAWYRAVRADLNCGKTRPDMLDPSTALVVGSMEGKPRHDSAAVVDQQFSGEPDESWPVTWIRGSATAAKQHALERAGAVGGTLDLRREGIVFAANAAEDGIRDAPTVLWITPEELTGASVVAPGAGADGEPGGATGGAGLAPHVVSRLVVRTQAGAHLFEVYGADDKAARIVARYLRP